MSNEYRGSIRPGSVKIYSGGTELTDNGQGDMLDQNGIKHATIDYEAREIIPINPQTGQPYFEIPKEGWLAGWTAGKEIEIEP